MWGGGCFANIKFVYSLGTSVLPYKWDSGKLDSDIPKREIVKELEKVILCLI